MVAGLGVIERDATAEPSGDSVSVSDDTLGEHGAYCMYTGRAQEGLTG